MNSLTVEICERRYQYHVIDNHALEIMRYSIFLFRCRRCRLERSLMKDFIIRYSHGGAFKKKDGVELKSITTCEFTRLANNEKRLTGDDETS